MVSLSVINRNVVFQSESLARAVYELPWEKMCIENRRIVLLFLLKLQNALVFTGFGGLRAGYKPAISVRMFFYTITELSVHERYLLKTATEFPYSSQFRLRSFIDVYVIKFSRRIFLSVPQHIRCKSTACIES